MNLVFLFVESYSLVLRFANHIITPDMYKIIGYGFIAVMIGRVLGIKAVDHLPANAIRISVYLLMGVLGIITFINAI